MFSLFKHLLRTRSNLYRRWKSKVRLFVIFRFEKIEKEYFWCFWRVSKRKNDGPLWRMCSRHANYSPLCIITLGLSWTTEKSSYCSRPTDICPIPRVLCPLSGLHKTISFVRCSSLLQTADWQRASGVSTIRINIQKISLLFEIIVSLHWQTFTITIFIISRI